MNQNTTDQGWQQLQSRIDKFVGHFLNEDYPALEYKTKITGLLQLPPEYNEQNIEKKS
jgi:hypothetical protein